MVARVLGVLALCLLSHQVLSFVHPGVLVSQSQLDFMKKQTLAGVEPFASTYVKAKASPWGSLTYKPQGPPSTIVCGSFSNPDIGCSTENNDSEAAVTQALLWYISGNAQYAQNAIAIMNKYATTLTGGHTNSNGPLQSSWTAQKFPMAAEIIYYNNAGWSAAEFAAFKNMLNTQYLPPLLNPSLSNTNGNWGLTMTSGMLMIAVVTENQAVFDQAVARMKSMIPAYFYYFPEDGTKFKTSNFVSQSWNGQTVFDATTSGICQETCRDLQHTQFGVAGTFNALETAYIQGVDMYTPLQNRLTAMMEFNTGLFPLGFSDFSGGGTMVPAASNVCGGNVDAVVNPTFEVGYNHYHNRMGLSLPKTLQYLTNSVRKLPYDSPAGAYVHAYAFETLHHGGDPGATPSTSAPSSSVTNPTASGVTQSVTQSQATAAPTAAPGDSTDVPPITVGPINTGVPGNAILINFSIF